MSTLPDCPKCESKYAYEDGHILICPECSHEWSDEFNKADDGKIFDSNENELIDGDNVIVIKDLKVKGSSQSIRKGTKVRNIRLRDDLADGHDIDCKIDGFGAMELKSEFVKKVK